MNTKDVKTIVQLRDNLGLVYKKTLLEKKLMEIKEKYEDEIRNTCAKMGGVIAAIIGVVFAIGAFLGINFLVDRKFSIFNSETTIRLVLNQIGAIIVGLAVGFLFFFIIGAFLETIIYNKEIKRKPIEKGSYEYKKKCREYREYINTMEIKDLQAIKNEFQSFLDYEDWKYIDRILYYFISHRADCLKEALRLLDEDKKHEEIMGALNQINYSLNEIKSCLYEINVGIDFMNHNLLGIQDTISVGSAEIVRTIQEAPKNSIFERA